MIRVPNRDVLSVIAHSDQRAVKFFEDLTASANASEVAIAGMGGGATNLTYTAATRVIASDTGTDATLPLMSSGDAGLVPASGGGTANFLRADGTFAAPGGGGATNLAYDASTRVVSSDTGTDATLTLADGTNAGLMASADFSKLAAITGTNTGDQASIVGITGTKAQFDTAVTDGNVQWVGDAPTAHTHLLAAGATDVTITAANLNVLDDGADTTLHFHAADRARANHTGTQVAATISDFNTSVAGQVTGKQDTLVSGANIVTVNGNSLLGSGDVVISGGGGAYSPVIGWAF